MRAVAQRLKHGDVWPVGGGAAWDGYGVLQEEARGWEWGLWYIAPLCFQLTKLPVWVKDVIS